MESFCNVDNEENRTLGGVAASENTGCGMVEWYFSITSFFVRSLRCGMLLSRYRLPVEHVWDELREKYFHNRIFPSLDGVIEALCQGLTALADDPQRLRSLTSFPHLNVLH